MKIKMDYITDWFILTNQSLHKEVIFLFAKVYYIALAMIIGLHYGIAAYNKKRRDLGFGVVITGVIFALTWPVVLPIAFVYAILREGGFIESSREQ